MYKTSVVLFFLLHLFIFFHLPQPTPTAAMSIQERTYIMVKPDGVQRGLVGNIISRFEQRGFKLIALKLVHATPEHLEKHYADLKGKPFFPGLIKYMASGPVAAMVWEGLDAVKTGRSMLGATNPLASAPGTIRGDFALAVGRNICHGSDSVESAEKEIALWFPEGVVQYNQDQAKWIFE
ncbi:nucleoside diphosphate kinase [Lentinus tigrinus ALCF2SS1-6]|uniref:Nucleoside diphosphate kinase n=2 Tax=Lentinus tigrinus TaxID=5365 RepID=A0A5C2SPX3_9APHY|nr:nucleoside diphosphate kinase [Lentinus tigrinus ALCF2SS1-6]